MNSLKEIERDKLPQHADPWSTYYNFKFSITGKLEDILDYREELREECINSVVSMFESTLRIKLGYVLESKWVLKDKTNDQ